MRVALVTPRFPPDVGGLENYVGRLADLLHGRPGWEVVVVTTGTGRRTTTEERRGVTVIRLGTWLTVSNTPVNPLWAWQLRRVLRRQEVDVVNAHAPVPGLADLASLSSPVPVVITYHSGSLLKGGGAVDVVLGAYERHVLPRVLARAEALVAVSPVSVAHATGRATLIPPGVDSDAFTPGEGPAGPHVLFVGRLERTSRWKGTHVLVEAFARVREQVPEARLVFVGDGDDAPELRRRAAELGLADAVDWVGGVPHDDLPQHYRAAAVTVLPSLTESESFGMTLVEAMACGRPVVGSAVGGIPFVVRDGVDGLLVPPGHSGALADALAGLLTDPDRAARLGEAGRVAARDRWDWRHTEESTVEVLRAAAGDVSGARRGRRRRRRAFGSRRP